MADTTKRLSRVLTDLHHGGRAVAGADPGVADAATNDKVALNYVVENPEPPLEEISTPFNYLFGDLKDAYPDNHLPVEPSSAVVTALKALGSAMVDAPPDGDPNSTIPPVYTYWGQFLDHDITANTDRNDVVGIEGDPLTPIEPFLVPGTLRNLREPALNLDSVYGNGPDAPHDTDDKEVPYDGIELEVGDLTVLGIPVFAAVPGADLPRVTATGKARIGDSRNDENLIVAQLHLAFLRFHNKAVEWVRTNQPEITVDSEVFERARELTRWHYQWIVVHDFLRRIAKGSVVDELLANPVADKVTQTRPDGTTEVFMPLEHSVAAYRFGHSMVRAAYDHNENFGRPLTGDDPDPLNPNRATFEQEFQFTGNNVIQGDGAGPGEFAFATLPDNWPIRWTRFTDADKPDRVARKIDTHLAPPLKDLLNEGNTDENGGPLPVRESRILKRLAVRNLLRGYRLGIPTGQAVAAALGVTPLTEEELLSGDQGVTDALIDGGFVDAAPLWFYVLKEAAVQEDGERLGEVGSRIICTTIIGQIQADPGSFLNASGGWTVANGVKLSNGGGEVGTIKAFLQFAGVQI